MIVGIDSMILIYAGKVPRKQSPLSKKDAELSIRAKILLRELAELKEKMTIILPAIAVAELLVPVPSGQKSQLLAELQRVFVCRPFDLPATVIASELWSRYKELPQDQQYENRDTLKSDAMIVATAKAGGATDFYSHDARCRKMASLVMVSHDLPKKGSTLFVEGEVRRGES